ncbi:MAG TPA: flagellar export protein FliJ [Thiobacillaceae bacterium]|nr:flagellar export protein FliJ [Thiobacillaceae bacterium]HNU64436.1 flagellar export protein FliJ [Thiobacillaceae bacterium]
MAGFPLQVLLDHARHRLQAAERLLRIHGRKEEAARQRLEEIRGYRREYQQRMAGAGTRGMGIHMLREFQAFLLKLDQAIAHQETEVCHAHARWLAAHEQWLAQRRQVKAYETLAARHRREALRDEEKREQRITDAAAAHLARPYGRRPLD